MLNAVLVMSTDMLVAFIFLIINTQITWRTIAFLWAKGCSWSQALDVYDLGDKHRKWLRFDMVFNCLVMLVSSYLFGNGHIYTPFSLLLGTAAIEAMALIALPIRCISAKVAIQNNPNLLDFNGKYKSTHDEYRKLIMLLDEKNLVAYKNSASRLWSELLLLNQRRKKAYESKKELDVVLADVQRLINKYTIEGDNEKRLKAQARLNTIIKQQADIDDFTRNVEDQIRNSETVFMDIRTNISVGQEANVLPDLTGYANKIKALEYTVDQLE